MFNTSLKNNPFSERDKRWESYCQNNNTLSLVVEEKEEKMVNHFIINSVSFTTGRKGQLVKEKLEELKEYSDELCTDYGLNIVDGVKGNNKNSTNDRFIIEYLIDLIVTVGSNQNESL